MRLFRLFLITAIATSAIVAHPVVEGPNTSRISERYDWDRDYSLDYSNDQLFMNNLDGPENGGHDETFSTDLLDVSPDLYKSPLSDDSKTYMAAENDAACATNPSKRDVSSDMLLGE